MSAELAATLKSHINRLMRLGDEASDEQVERMAEALLLTVAEILEVVMAGIDDLNTSVANLEAAVSGESAELGQVVAGLQQATATIAQLQQQIQAGSGVTAEQLDEVVGHLNTIAQGAAAATQSAQTAAAPPAPSPQPAPAPAPEPAPAPAPEPAPAPASAPEPSPAAAQPDKTVYTFTGDPSLVDPGAWPASGFETTDTPPRPLYYFSGDTAAGQQNGNGLSGGAWQAYTGPVQPAGGGA